MAKRPNPLVIWFCVLLALPVMAQRDSVTLLQPVLITQSLLNNHVLVAYTLPTDSIALAQTAGGSLTDLLRKQGIGHVRSYGPGGLASPSFRGTGGSHTAVLWNGINLISPLSGQLDFSLMPITLFDQASIQTGGAASLFGNGSIGGTIQLNNAVRFSEGLAISGTAQLGSFNTNFQDLALRWSGEKFGTSVKVFHGAAENDFSYINSYTLPEKKETRKHNAYKQAGILNQYFWQASPKSILSLRLWHQQSTYEVPKATTLTQNSLAVEQNSFSRILTGLDYAGNRFSLVYQGAYLHQSLDYRDPAINLISQNKSNTFIQNAEVNITQTAKAQFTGAVNYTWEQGRVDAFGESVPQRHRLALVGAQLFRIGSKLKTSFSLREELVNGSTTPLAPKLSVAWHPTTILTLFSHVSRNYRLPTFNDLYWRGSGASGNGNLKPELSLSYEMGMELSWENFSAKTVAFSNHVDDWILWSPGEGQIWMPENIKKVWSRGLELQGKWKHTLGKLKTEIAGLYSFTRSTNQAVYQNGNPNEIDKQLPLTPVHEGSLSLRADVYGFQFTIITSYTGMQFTDTDNSDFFALSPYTISNLWLSKPLHFGKAKFTMTGEVNNIFNESYQARPGYPMPGINYKASIQFNLTNKTIPL